MFELWKEREYRKLKPASICSHNAAWNKRVSRFSYHPEEGGYLQSGLKTDAGRNRIVPVHPKIKPYLAAWLDKGGDTIICDGRGRAVSSSQYREHSRPSSVRPMPRPNGAATRLHSVSADPLAVKWLLGHSTKSDITEHYTHETIIALKAAVGRLA